MQIDAKTGDLFTDSGEFLKRLNCPKRMEWNAMGLGNLSVGRLCHVCDRVVHDTAMMTDQDLVRKLHLSVKVMKMPVRLCVWLIVKVLV
jgi:hypothetical protein